MNRMESLIPVERVTTEDFQNFQEIFRQFSEHRGELAEVQRLLGAVKIENNPDTWISSTCKTPEGAQISIGEKALPPDVLERWGWGVRTPEQQYMVKLSHEYAHLVQQVFDESLLRFLDGQMNYVEKDAHPYIQLYALLTQIGIVNRLADEQIYHQQSQATGNLSVPTYEDIAETLGSRLLSPDYFRYRMGRSKSSVTPEQVQEIESHLQAMLENLKRRVQPAALGSVNQ